MVEVTLGHSVEANCQGQASRDNAYFDHKATQETMFEVSLGVILWKPIVGARPLRTVPMLSAKVAQKKVFRSHAFRSLRSNPWVVWGSRSLFFRTGTASLGVLDVQMPMRPDADLRCAASARLLRGFCAVSFFGTVRPQKIVEVTFGVILCKPIVRARPRGTVLILSTKPHKNQCLKSLWGVILWNSIVGARPLRTVPVLSAKSYNKKWLKSLWVSFLEANC